MFSSKSATSNTTSTTNTEPKQSPSTRTVQFDTYGTELFPPAVPPSSPRNNPPPPYRRNNPFAIPRRRLNTGLQNLDNLPSVVNKKLNNKTNDLEAVVVLVDNSGSMNKTNTTEAVNNIAQELGDTLLVVYSFSDEVNIVYSGKASEYTNHIFDADGATNLYHAICKVDSDNKLLSDGQVFIISDGMDNIGEATLDSAKKSIENLNNRGWNVDTLGLDLSAAAEAGNLGVNYTSSSRAALPDLARNMSRSISAAPRKINNRGVDIKSLNDKRRKSKFSVDLNGSSPHTVCPSTVCPSTICPSTICPSSASSTFFSPLFVESEEDTSSGETVLDNPRTFYSESESESDCGNDCETI